MSFCTLSPAFISLPQDEQPIPLQQSFFACQTAIQIQVSYKEAWKLNKKQLGRITSKNQVFVKNKELEC